MSMYMACQVCFVLKLWGSICWLHMSISLLNLHVVQAADVTI
jgi:hypothetical protein